LALIRLVSPDSDPEIIAIVAMLEARGIPSYVRGGGFGGLYPGVQINAFNTRDIMVPEEKAAEALALLRDFQAQKTDTDTEPPVRPKKSGWFRNLLELLLFGWFVPTSRPKSDNATTARRDGTPNNRIWTPPARGRENHGVMT
jgi:hypothetical protein